MSHQENILLNLVAPAHMEGNDGLRGLCKLLQALLYNSLHPGLKDPGLHMYRHTFMQDHLLRLD